MSHPVYGIILTDTSESMREVRQNGQLHVATLALEEVLGDITTSYASFPTRSLSQAVDWSKSVEVFPTVSTDAKVVACISNGHCEDATSFLYIEQVLQMLPEHVFVVLIPVGDLEERAAGWFDLWAQRREMLGGRFDVIRPGEDIREALGRHAQPFAERAAGGA